VCPGTPSLPVSFQFGLTEKDGTEVGVEYLDARQEVERPHVLLVRRVVADRDAQRQPVVVHDGGGQSARPVADRFQTADREGDRVLVEREVVRTGRPDVDGVVVRDGRLQPGRE
jgi:hypothetical protein